VEVGGHIAHPSGAKGQFFEPTVVTGVTRDMRIWRQEVFGPVAVIVPFDSDEEAVALANDCDFGLGSAVFSGDARRANAIAQRLEVSFWMPSRELNREAKWNVSGTRW
jgi:acyl-CoA reductase-like NAD-dependent aldehyde dehydrogenase